MDVQSLDVVKQLVDQKLKLKESVAGMMFVNAKGSIGTILAELSPRGKLQASMTCVEGGPDHIRERSDWHQCYLSPEKAKNKPRKTGGPNTGKSLRTNDGTLLHFQDILETDGDDVKALKEQNNIAFNQAKAAREALIAKEKADKAAARTAKQEADKAARAEVKRQENAAKLAQSAKVLQDYAKSINAQVSPNAPAIVEAQQAGVNTDTQ